MKLFPGLLLLLALPCMVAGKPKRPHILFFLLDDLGYNDVSWAEYHDVPTPNLKNLREESLELMQMYAQPKCTASRAALMTGRYPYKMGLQTKDVFSRVRNNTLDYSYKLLPAYLKDLGYHTHMVGKWHLGFCNVNATPIKRGFDTHFGSWANLDNRFNQTSSGTFEWHWNNEPYWQAQGTFTTHLISNHTQHLLQKHFGNDTTKDEPMFLYVAYLTPHKPAERLDWYMENTNCSKIPETIVENNANVTNLHRNYCSMVAATDEGIGNITQTLRDLGVIDDFIIIFGVDNGGAIDVGANNFPLRGNKQSVYEGGTRTRGLLRAPAYLQEGHKTGQYNGLIHITDWLPTLVSAAGGCPSTLTDDLDGMDLWKEITEGKPTKRQWMVYNLDTSRELAAIRFKNATHDFKLVYSNSSNSEPGYRYPDPRPQSEQEDFQKKRYQREGQAFFLYDLSTNPREVPASAPNSPFPDAAETNSEIFSLMKAKLQEELENEVPIIKYSNIKGKDSGLRVDGAYMPAGC